MNMLEIPFEKNMWEKINPVEFKGRSGSSYWKTFETGNVRVRIGASRGRRLKLSLYRCHDYVHDGAGVMPSRNLGRELLASH